jgi:hypothetical protein
LQEELSKGAPAYLHLLEKMFAGVCVTGETSYVPGSRSGPQDISSAEDDDGGDTTGTGTPQSTGSKRSFGSFNTRSTASSPNKKARSPSLRVLQSSMRDLNTVLENRTAANSQIWANRQKNEEDQQNKKKARRQRIREQARQLPWNHEDSRLEVAILKLVRSEADMESFEDATDSGKTYILEHLAGVGI